MTFRSRELSSFRVRKRAWNDELASDFTEIGAIENNILEMPPSAVSFCKASKNSLIFAVSDEAGYVNLFDSGELSSAHLTMKMQKKQESMIGSVKCLGSHPTISDLVLSGSRDGSFAIWDLRCKRNSKSRCDEVCHPSTSMVKGAHLSSQAGLLSLECLL
ncbi:hypothetical protein V6Z11_D11G393900 [Gossypium hirsutum]